MTGKCIFVDDNKNKCIKSSTFNLPGLKAKYCGTHRTSKMVDVVHKKCLKYLIIINLV
jgi:hypothetical protein